MELFINFFTAAPLLELLIIILAKISEVSLGTLRIILIGKGYRREGTIIAFVGIMIWVFMASQVLLGLAETPIKGIAYSTGFAIGVYLGSRIEGYIALGRVLIQAIVSKDNSEILVEGLRHGGYAVTTVEARGRDSDKQVLMIFANRKGKDVIIAEILKLDGRAMIITNDISTLRGGTIYSSRVLTNGRPS